MRPKPWIRSGGGPAGPDHLDDRSQTPTHVDEPPDAAQLVVLVGSRPFRPLRLLRPRSAWSGGPPRTRGFGIDHLAFPLRDHELGTDHECAAHARGHPARGDRDAGADRARRGLGGRAAGGALDRRPADRGRRSGADRGGYVPRRFRRCRRRPRRRRCRRRARRDDHQGPAPRRDRRSRRRGPDRRRHLERRAAVPQARPPRADDLERRRRGRRSRRRADPGRPRPPRRGADRLHLRPDLPGGS